jgi:hypothetical protein
MFLHATSDASSLVGAIHRLQSSKPAIHEEYAFCMMMMCCSLRDIFTAS